MNPIERIERVERIERIEITKVDTIHTTQHTENGAVEKITKLVTAYKIVIFPEGKELVVLPNIVEFIIKQAERHRIR